MKSKVIHRRNCKCPNCNGELLIGIEEWVLLPLYKVEKCDYINLTLTNNVDGVDYYLFTCPSCNNKAIVKVKDFKLLEVGKVY